MLPALRHSSAPVLAPASLAALRSLLGSSSCVIRGYAEAATAAVQEVQTPQQYESIMNSLAENDSVGIIDFTAKWCGPCKAIAPIYEELSKQYPKVKFLKLDIDIKELEPIVTDHGITGVPTFAVYKGPRKVEHFTGARVDRLRAVLQKHAE